MTLKKVVITGLGIVSSIGVGVDAVLKSLKEGKSGIKKSQDFVDRQMRSQVAGLVDIDLKEFIDRRALRFPASPQCEYSAPCRCIPARNPPASDSCETGSPA